MDIKGLRGEQVRLVPPERSAHLENALRWMNDPAVIATLNAPMGASRRAEEAWFDSIEAARDPNPHWAILDLAGRHLGMIDLRIHWALRSAGGGLVIGERSAWGQGYARDAVRVRTRFAFETLGLHRVEGHTISPAIRRVYEKCGYRHEGTQRQKIWRHGTWQDAEMYAILDQDFRALPPPPPRPRDEPT